MVGKVVFFCFDLTKFPLAASFFNENQDKTLKSIEFPNQKVFFAPFALGGNNIIQTTVYTWNNVEILKIHEMVMRCSMASLFCTRKRIWDSNGNQMDLTGSINISTQQIHHLGWEVADSVCTKIIFFILCPDCDIDAPWKHVRNNFRLYTLMHIHWHRQTPPSGVISNDEKNDPLTLHHAPAAPSIHRKSSESV